MLCYGAVYVQGGHGMHAYIYSILHALQISQIGTYGRFDARPKLRNGILSIEVHHIVILSI